MTRPVVVVHQYFTDAQIALKKELIQHPELCMVINQLASNEWTEQLGVIHTYLGLHVDRDFAPEEMDTLYESLTAQLIAHREEVEAAVREQYAEMKADPKKVEEALVDLFETLDPGESLDS